MRIGQSTDIHRLTENRDLIIGGVKIPHPLGLLGHSDADVLVHAISEAIIGALGLGDLGTHFPDDKPENKDRSSLDILQEVYSMMKAENYRIGNIDCLVLIEKPVLAPYLKTMKTNLAKVLDCRQQLINIKATRGEGLGFIGRQEGAAATAVVLLEEIQDE